MPCAGFAVLCLSLCTKRTLAHSVGIAIPEDTPQVSKVAMPVSKSQVIQKTLELLSSPVVLAAYRVLLLQGQVALAVTLLQDEMPKYLTLVVSKAKVH